MSIYTEGKVIKPTVVAASDSADDGEVVLLEPQSSPNELTLDLSNPKTILQYKVLMLLGKFKIAKIVFSKRSKETSMLETKGMAREFVYADDRPYTPTIPERLWLKMKSL